MRLRSKKQLRCFCFVLAIFVRTALAEDVFYLEIIVNGKSSNQIVECIRHAGEWKMAADDLLSLGIVMNHTSDENVLLNRIPGAEVTYDAASQRLFLNLPSSFFPLQHLRGNVGERTQQSGARDRGLTLNYTLLASRATDEVTQSLTSMWHEATFFDPGFIIVNNGIYQDDDNVFSSSGYRRFETYYRHDREDNLWGITAGDVINATPTWGRSVRLGGLRIARDFELDPTLITYPLPQFYGEAGLPSSVDLLINDQLRWQDSVGSGPFLVDVMPYLSGAGVANIVTTNIHGQQQQQAVNFYVTNQLLAAGMSDYDLTIGFRREDFGLLSNEYASSLVASGSLRYGLNSYVTPQFLIQAGEGLRLGGAGLTLLAGSAGVFDVAYSFSDYLGSHGRQASFAYSYTRNRVGINTSITQRFDDYVDLASFDSTVSSDKQLQVSLSSYHDSLGSFNLGYFRLEDRASDARSLLNLSWNRYFSRTGITAFLNINRQLFSSQTTGVSLSLSMPLGSRGQASAAARHNRDRGWDNAIQLTSNAPYDGGLGWNLGFDNSYERNRYARVNWRSNAAEISFGTQRSRNQSLNIAQIEGALVVMDSGIYASRMITDSFAVINSDQPNVPVMIGHQYVAHTNDAGKLLVPDLYSYVQNRISIDPLQLPANVTIDSIEKIIVPRRKGGVSVNFSMRFSQAALVEIQAVDQQPLPAGSVLQNKYNAERLLVGWDGELYIENFIEPIHLYWEEGDCTVVLLPAQDRAEIMPRLGPFLCVPEQEIH